jgi:hypothetical protein
LQAFITLLSLPDSRLSPKMSWRCWMFPCWPHASTSMKRVCATFASG